MFYIDAYNEIVTHKSDYIGNINNNHNDNQQRHAVITIL